MNELKHTAKPGYRKVFLIAFAVMAAYMAFILISSPGKVEYKRHDKAGEKHHH